MAHGEVKLRVAPLAVIYSFFSQPLISTVSLSVSLWRLTIDS